MPWCCAPAQVEGGVWCIRSRLFKHFPYRHDWQTSVHCNRQLTSATGSMYIGENPTSMYLSTSLYLIHGLR